MESTVEDPRIGLVLNGRYRITAPIGEGGMGLVYRGERLQLRRPVAIKFLHTPYADSAKFVARFEREARAMSMLSHPYCVSVLDFGVHQSPYIIMDYVTGATLRQVLDEERLSSQRALHITRQVLIGLAHAHGQGVIHRDVKPGNIMLGEATGLSDHVRIFDFGLAKLHDPELHGEASIAAVVGTPAYMAPEQARADKVDGRVDLYAAGIVLFEMLTGRKPFEAESAYQMLCLQRDSAPPALRELAPELSVELAEVVQKALEKDPADRFQTAEEFGAALESTPEWAAARADAHPGKAHATEAHREPVAVATVPTGPGALEQGRAAQAPRRGGRGWVALLLLLAVFGVGWWKLHLEPNAVATERVSAPAATTEKAKAPAAEPPEPLAAPSPEPSMPSVPAWAAELAESAASAMGVASPDASGAAGDAEELAGSGAGSGAAQPGTPALNTPSSAAGELDEAEGPSELSEAALAAADEALNDREEREVVLTAAAEPRARPVESLADVRSLIAKGKTDSAIRGIQQLRRKHPRDAQLPYLLGNLYFEKGWALDGLAKYRETIGLSASYRKNARIQRNAIRALSQTRTYPRARALLVRDVGRIGLPALRRAARADASPLVRRRASSIVKQLAR